MPGNATADLQQRFRTDATVYKMQTRHYYVAPSTLRPGTNSLWRLPCRARADPEEVASGIDRLLITYGIDGGAAAGQQNVDHYAGADGVTAWDKVVAVRLQMLIATAKDNVTRDNAERRLRRRHDHRRGPSPAQRAVEVVTVRNGAP